MAASPDGKKRGVVGFVDAQNSFGAMLRQSYGCRFSETQQIEAMNIGDQQWGDFSYGHEAHKHRKHKAAAQ